MTDSDRQSAANPRLYGGWLLLARVLWLVVVIADIALFIASVPGLYNIQRDFAAEPIVRANLNDLDLSIDFYATLQVANQIIVSSVCCAVAAVIFWRKSDEPMALFVALFLVTFGAAPNPSYLATFHAVWYLPAKFLQFIGLAALPAFFYLFPDGRFIPRWTRWLAVGWAVQMVYFVFGPTLPSPFNTWVSIIGQITYLGILGSLVFAQIYRYRRVSGPVERQQTKLVVFALLAVATIGIAVLLLSMITGWKLEGGTLISMISAMIVGATLLLIPVSIGIAILRYRLWDVDPIINRTLVYGALTLSVVGIYVLVVGVFGALLQVRGTLIISLVATGIVAVLFQPLREKLQRTVNRLMYGERDEPYAVISRLGQRLEATLAPDAVLPTIVETVREALKLPYVAIMLQQGDELVLAAASGSSPDQLPRWHGDKVREAMMPPLAPAHLVTLPLTYQNEAIGELLLALRSPGEMFSPADRRLIDTLARQAGIAAHAVRLHADLQRSRERLVTAREEERRRLRRDLHDGLGPALAAQTLKVGSARYLLTHDLATADKLLAELEHDIDTALQDVRRLVYNLRPPALDELGLISAIREQAAHYQGEHTDSPLRIEVDAPAHLPSLPAAVEVAVYRIVQEALTNVVRHAKAHTCRIRLAVDGNKLCVEIVDDGVGLPPDRCAGVGLHSMQERAEELGGIWTVETSSAGGTRVAAQFPLAKGDA